MSREENMANAKHMVDDVINGSNMDMIDELVAPDYVLHDNSSETYKGPEGLKKFFSMMHTALPDIHVMIDDIVADENKVALRVTTRGTNTGTMMGMPPTGKQINIQSINISHYRNGKQVEVWEVDDSLGMLQQMGVAPPMGQAVRP